MIVYITSVISEEEQRSSFSWSVQQCDQVFRGIGYVHIAIDRPVYSGISTHIAYSFSGSSYVVPEILRRTACALASLLQLWGWLGVSVAELSRFLA